LGKVGDSTTADGTLYTLAAGMLLLMGWWQGPLLASLGVLWGAELTSPAAGALQDDVRQMESHGLLKLFTLPLCSRCSASSASSIS
jgi:hypothetical protein